MIDKPKIIHPIEESWFSYSSTLRIHGDQLDFIGIECVLGLQSTYRHRKGERKGPKSPPYKDDAWHYECPLEESKPLSEHLMALWTAVKPHVTYLRQLKKTNNVDIFCGYRSNSQIAGFEVDYRCLDMFIALEVPFGVSIITLE